MKLPIATNPEKTFISWYGNTLYLSHCENPIFSESDQEASYFFQKIDLSAKGEPWTISHFPFSFCNQTFKTIIVNLIQNL